MHILVIDDDHLVHRTWRRLVRSLPGRWTISSALSCRDARDRLRTLGPSTDVVILDLALPDGWGLDLAPAIRNACPAAEVMVISGHLDARQMVAAQGLGYRVLDKPPKPRELGLLRQAVDMLTRDDGYGVRALYPELTDRQAELVELAVRHRMDWDAVARAMGVTQATLRTHRRNIRHASGVPLQQMVCALAGRMGYGRPS